MNTFIKKMKIAVLYGGISSERAVSLKSGAAVIKALRKLGAGKILPVILNNNTRWVSELSSEKPDFVFIALHGKYGEDGTVQSILEFLKLPYCGSGSGASFLAMDKVYSKKIFQFENIPTPPWFSVHRPSANETDKRKLITALYRRAIKKYGERLVVKPSDEGSAVGVSIVYGKSLNEFQKALYTAWRYSKTAVIEQYIPGVEITVGILDGKALTPIEIIPKGKFYDYTSKYMPGMSSHLIPPRNISAQTSARCRELALKAFKALDCRAFARVDMRVTPSGKIYILEVNTIPGLTRTSLLPDAARFEGISFETLVEKMILSSLDKR